MSDDHNSDFDDEFDVGLSGDEEESGKDWEDDDETPEMLLDGYKDDTDY